MTTADISTNTAQQSTAQPPSAPSVQAQLPAYQPVTQSHTIPQDAPFLLQPPLVQLAINKGYIAMKQETLVLRCRVPAPVDFCWKATMNETVIFEFIKFPLNALADLVPEVIGDVISDYLPPLIHVKDSKREDLYTLSKGELSSDTSHGSPSASTELDGHIGIEDKSDKFSPDREFNVKFHNVITGKHEPLEVYSQGFGAVIKVTQAGQEIARFEKKHHLDTVVGREYAITVAAGVDMSFIAGLGVALDHELTELTKDDVEQVKQILAVFAMFAPSKELFKNLRGRLFGSGPKAKVRPLVVRPTPSRPGNVQNFQPGIVTPAGSSNVQTPHPQVQSPLRPGVVPNSQSTILTPPVQGAVPNTRHSTHHLHRGQ